MRFAKLALGLVAAAFLMAGCSKPEDIVLGQEPLKQLAEQGDQFRKMPEADRMLLASYLTVYQMGKAFGGKDLKPVTGRTVGEVMVDARAWGENVKKAEAAEKAKQAEAAALREKVLAERKSVAQKIGAAATVAVVGKKILEENWRAGRYDSMLVLDFAVENKADKVIRQLKGRVTFKDATGDAVGWLPIDFDKPIEPGKTLKTDTGSGWKINKFRNGDIEKIAGREFSTMTTTFEPESVAFEGGEVIKAPDVRE